MGRMCRYSYLSGACANKHIESLDCVGENECEFSEVNVLTKKKELPSLESGADKWLGLYCEKHKRFLCPGKDNCQTLGSAQKSLDVTPDRTPRPQGEL